MPSKKSTTEKYLFADSERAFVHSRLARAEAAMAEIGAVMSFIIEREGLPGKWDMAPDKSGIVQVEPKNA